ncbi:MAG: arylsulfatase [Planctomycetota bacterium]
MIPARCMTIAFAIPFLLPVVALAKPARPNVVIILVDDMGYSDVGCYGGEIETPNIDRLAANGLRFTQFYNCAKCESTRATLLSGRYFPEVGGGKLANCITIPEAMRTAGYQTMMVGKWHQSQTPTQRGFDRYFGFLNGCVNFFTGVSSQKNGTHFMLDDERWEVPKLGFYTTEAFSDHTLRLLEERDLEKPFFFYIAHNAPHYPLQAPEKDVAKYRGRYKAGWHQLREQRLARMIDLGVVPVDQELSATPTDVLSWDSLTEQEVDHHDLMMATYAAMIDKVDQSVGALVAKLESQNALDNTLIMFLSDNGACPFQRTEAKTRENNLMPWDAESWWLYDQNWAHACNTPYRKYKQNQHEGGISTPMIMHWPAVLAGGGQFDRDPAHLVDLHATCLDLAGIDYADLQQDGDIGPARGLSLAPVMRGQTRHLHEELYFQFSKYSALRAGAWKLVDGTELYNIEEDRIEMHNLADDYPERFQAMNKRWEQLNTEFGGKKKKK